MSHFNQLKADLQILANPDKAKILAGFFKTGKGQYGEGDIFLGVMVPQQRSIAKKYSDLSFANIRSLLKSRIHEHRLISLLILVNRYKVVENKEKENIADFYLHHADQINNWDLVDLSAPYILGDYLYGRSKAVLYRFAESNNLWKRRISIIATLGFIKKGELQNTLAISKMLLNDKHDLIHKAVGWMLREVGKRDIEKLEQFLSDHVDSMPRTMLRYAIEKFDEPKRRYWLTK